jgi:outer membrane protein OmpA-like peptidoglycan-associated protein
MGLSLARRALPLILLGASLAGCDTFMGGGPTASVTVDDPGYKALATGDYTKSREEFEPAQAKAPRDPYLELDLAVAYQQLGRMDLAEALDRQAMVDGKDVYPPYTTFDRDKGHTIAYIACENIEIGLKASSCEPMAPQQAPPPPVRNFIVFFDFNKTNLTAEAHAVISEAVKTVKSSGTVHILVTGHTDTVGSDSYNQGLSVRRAQSVKNEMQNEGVDGSTISIDGKSFHDPLVPTGPGVREPQNRRAVIDLGG